MTAPAPAVAEADAAVAAPGPVRVDTVVGGRLVRFDRAERWLHWVNAALVLVLIATGSIMYIGALSGLVGRRLLVRDVHLWSGLLLPIPFLAVVAGRWGYGFRRDCARLGRFLTDDWRWLSRRQRRHGDLRVGKFNAGQKVNAVLVAGALPVMFGTGLLLHWARSFPESLRTGATFVHDWGYVALGLLVAGHIVKAMADPVALHAMRTGLAPARWAKAAHPRWHDEVVGPAEAAGGVSDAQAEPEAGPAGGADRPTPYDGTRSDQP